MLHTNVFYNLDDDFMPPLKKACLFIRYNEDAPVSGWRIDDRNVF